MTEDARSYQGKSAYRGKTDDGRNHFIFSQSSIKAVEICPERGRRALLKLHPRTYTDSTAMGEAFHLAVELDLQSQMDGQGELSLSDLWYLAMDEFTDLMDLDGSRWVKIKTNGTIHDYLWLMLNRYKQDVLRLLSPQAVELHLGPYTIYEDSKRVIQLEGTADYLDSISGLADWKTASRRWEAREHQKWDVQPTVYTWLLARNHRLLHPTPAFEVPVPWAWHVFYTNGECEQIKTTRGPADWAWLKDRCYGLALQLEAELPVWFKNPTHWLCSPKYCDGYKECRGDIESMEDRSHYEDRNDMQSPSAPLMEG